MDPINDPRCQGLAMDALHAGLHQDETGVTTALEMLVDEYGAAGTETAILVWCDTLIRHTGGWGRQTQLRFERHGTGDTVDVDDVEPGALWAGRVLVARRSLDRPQYEALLSVIANNPELASTYVAELLTVVVAALTDHMRKCHPDADAGSTSHDPRRGPADWPSPPPGSTWN